MGLSQGGRGSYRSGRTKRVPVGSYETSQERDTDVTQTRVSPVLAQSSWSLGPDRIPSGARPPTVLRVSGVDDPGVNPLSNLDPLRPWYGSPVHNSPGGLVEEDETDPFLENGGRGLVDLPPKGPHPSSPVGTDITHQTVRTVEGTAHRPGVCPGRYPAPRPGPEGSRGSLTPGPEVRRSRGPESDWWEYESWTGFATSL